MAKSRQRNNPVTGAPERWCVRHFAWQPLSAFKINHQGGYYQNCESCRAKQRLERTRKKVRP